MVQDNEYAISVPVEVQTAGGNISRLVSGFPNFHFEEIDGTDPVASYAAFKRAVDHCRAGERSGIRPRARDPSVLAFAVRRRAAYRPDAERQRDAPRDPITRMQMFLLREGILDEKGINKLEKQVEEELQIAVDRALAAAFPTPETITNFIYSPDLDPPRRSSTPSRHSRKYQNSRVATARSPRRPKTMAELINATLRDEMRRDERIVIFGEDVADCSREEYLKQKLSKGRAACSS